jgi:hypothetical protein
MSNTRTEELDGVKINVISAHEWLLADNRPSIETKDTPGNLQRQVQSHLHLMARSIQISTARTMLNSGDPVDIRVSAFSACRLKAGARCQRQNDRPQIQRL